MRNKDINEWLLDKGIDPNTEIIVDGTQWFLSDILEMHLQEQFAIQRVSNLLCGVFEPNNNTSSATKCKNCGREKWEHPKAT